MASTSVTPLWARGLRWSAPNWLSHLEYDWRSPVWRHWWEELTRDHRLIRFDQRGIGLSDLDVEDMSFEARVGDLETAVDALGLEMLAPGNCTNASASQP